jgi:hypothetical protein
LWWGRRRARQWRWRSHRSCSSRARRWMLVSWTVLSPGCLWLIKIEWITLGRKQRARLNIKYSYSYPHILANILCMHVLVEQKLNHRATWTLVSTRWPKIQNFFKKGIQKLFLTCLYKLKPYYYTIQCITHFKSTKFVLQMAKMWGGGRKKFWFLLSLKWGLQLFPVWGQKWSKLLFA